MMNPKILVIDDETAILKTIADILEDEGMESIVCPSAEEGIRILKKDATVDAVLLDVWMRGMDGLQALEWIRSNSVNCPVIMMSGHATLETAVAATRSGAYDFLEKPLSYDKLIITLNRAIREFNLRHENASLKQRQTFIENPIIGEDATIKKIRERIRILSTSSARVLIYGENGTGKELVARQIHLNGSRRNKPFVEMNCAAIPEELIESTLFGHEKGAFTGANEKRIGKFDQANGGTLFLDEIGDMSLNTQAKILRVLQEMRFERVGGREMIHVDVRVISASNKKLEDEIKNNNFRQDLLYRLNVIPIELPPLRERRDDIPLLIENFIETFALNSNYPRKKFSAPAMKILKNYYWPGNIRELKNIIERVLILVAEETVEERHVPPVIQMTNPEYIQKIQQKNYPNDLKQAKSLFERNFIKDKLEKNGWNVSKTAEAIGLARPYLVKKMKFHDLNAKHSAE